MSRATTAPPQHSRRPTPDLPPRERILAAARELFYARGIRAVSVDEIAAAADTNKMTLYRHFESKDRLVAEYLRLLSDEADRIWQQLESEYPRDARKQLEAWLQHLCEGMADPGNRGCAFANAAVEIPERGHPAREVIERHKLSTRDHIERLCRSAGFSGADKLADEIFLLLEGARVNVQSMGREGPCHRMPELFRTLLNSKTNTA